jgi:hypothetical protein
MCTLFGHIQMTHTESCWITKSFIMATSRMKLARQATCSTFSIHLFHQLQVVKRTDGVDLLDGPYVVQVPASVTTYLIKDLQLGLTYSIIVSFKFLFKSC